MFEKIEIFDKRYSELSERLYQPSVAGNPEEYQKIMKEIKSIEEIVLTYRKYKEAVQTEKDSLEILEETSDKELKELAQIELDEAKNNIKSLAEDLKILLLPKDPNDERNVIVEIRGGAGGEEAALFSGVLFRMYSICSVRFCSECTRCMPKKRALKSRLSMPMKPKSAVTRKFPL